MVLTFSETKPGRFVATFQASADFNLHVEMASGGVVKGNNPTISILRKTPSASKYVSSYSCIGSIMDTDFSALVYPVDIQVICNFSATGIATE